MMTEDKPKGTSRASQPRQAANTFKSAAKPGTKVKPGAKTKPSANVAKPLTEQTGEQVVLLAGGNPQIAKADGDAPVQAYIAAMPGWKSDLGKRLDELIVRTVPNVRKAVRWNSTRPKWRLGSRKPPRSPAGFRSR